MNENIKVKVENITKTFGEGEVAVQALRDVSININSKDFAVLKGPSGSGKTTLLNLIGALDKPTSGEIFVENQKYSELSKTELSLIRKHRIGFVFQAYNLIPVLTAFENAEFVLNIQGVAKDIRRDKVMAILKEVGLEGMEHRRPDELSGGQQQRVAIARAIVSEPAIVLADEPTANVDSRTADSLISLMEELNEHKGITFLFSSHDEQVINRAKRVITLHDGEIQNDETR